MTAPHVARCGGKWSYRPCARPIARSVNTGRRNWSYRDAENSQMLSVQEDLPQDMPAWWYHPGWYHALTLAERVASRPGGSTLLAEGDDESRQHAQQLLQQWKAQPPFHKGTHFAERL